MAGVAQLLGASFHSWEVTGLIPGQGTYPGCRSSPQLGYIHRQPIDVSLSSFLKSNEKKMSLGENKKKKKRTGLDFLCKELIKIIGRIKVSFDSCFLFQLLL